MSKEPKIKPIVIVGAGGMGRDTQWLIERINEEEPTYEIQRSSTNPVGSP